jgi:hypothetical protein
LRAPYVGDRMLDRFRRISRNVDFVTPLESLLLEYRRGNIADPYRTLEDRVIQDHLGDLFAAWDRALTVFPDTPWRRRSMVWEHFRGRRDAYAKRLLVEALLAEPFERRTIVNPAAVFGRHARWLASRLPDFSVVATDIDPTWDRAYRIACFWKCRRLNNYSFIKEDIFQSTTKRQPAAVTFFGACGSVTDGCMDYAISSESLLLICRSCCHENIAANLEIVRRPGVLNQVFEWKNRLGERARKKPKFDGFYRSDRYMLDAYPRSRAARNLIDSETYLRVAQNSVDSDICRFIIDLDRCLYLREHGYDVLYREELFFAAKS